MADNNNNNDNQANEFAVLLDQELALRIAIGNLQRHIVMLYEQHMGVFEHFTAGEIEDMLTGHGTMQAVIVSHQNLMRRSILHLRVLRDILDSEESALAAAAAASDDNEA